MHMRRLVVVLWVAFGLLGIPMLSGCSKDPEALYSSAMSRVEKRDFAGAIVDLKAALQSQPNDARMRFALGKVYNQVFDSPSAEKELKRAADLGAVEGGRVMVEYARALRGQQKYAELLKEVQPADVFENEQRALILALRGRSQHVLGDVSGAQASYEAAVKIDSKLADVKLLKAQIAAGKGDASGALAIIEEVTKENPAQFDAWSYKARLLRALGREQDALLAYNEVLKISPFHFDGLVNRSTILVVLSRAPEAQKDVDVLVKAYKGDPRVLVQKALVELGSGRFKQAVESTDLALKENPELMLAYLIRGLAFDALGSALQAEKALRTYISEQPRDIVAIRALTSVLVKLKQGTRALETIRPLLEADLGDARDQLLAAEAYAQLGNYPKAIEHYERASKVAPDRADIDLQKSFAYIRAGRTDAGLDGIERVLAKAKQASVLDEFVVLMHLRQNDVDKASKVIESLEKRAGTTPLFLNLKGMVLHAQKQREAAAKSFEAALKADPAFLPAAQNLANLDLADGNIGAAKKRFEGVLGKDDKNIQAMLAHAALSRFSGDSDAAESMLNRAVKAHPLVMEGRAMLLEVLLAKRAVTQAVQLAEDTLALLPQHPRSYLMLSEARLAEGSTNAAAQALSRWVQRDPNSAEAHFQLGRVLMIAKKTREAEDNLRKAIELQPGYPAPMLLLATLMVQDKRDSDAFAFGREVQKRFPKASLGYVIEGEVLEMRGRSKEALSLYQKAFEVEPSGSMVVRVFRAKKATGNLKAAMDDATKWLQRNPGDVGVRSVVAYELLRAGDAKGAAEQYEQIGTSPSVPNEWLNNLAYAYFKMGDARALPTAEKALKMRPNDAATADTLAQILMERREYKRAIELLRRASTAEPGDPEIRYHLALALDRNGDKAAAKEELSRALATKQDFPARPSAVKMLEAMR